MEKFALLPGSLLHERYNIEKVIVEDGAVVEYVALDVASGARHRIRHVHILYSDVALARKKRQTFRQYSAALMALHHPTLLRVVDCFDEGPDFFTVCVWVDGESLVGQTVPIAEDVAMLWIHQILDAIEAVAGAPGPFAMPGITPNSVRLRENGSVVVGAPRLEDDGSPDLSSESPFAAPEGGASIRSSLYSLGALAYWLLSGRMPPTASERKHDRVALKAPHGVRPVVARTILSMMALESWRRPGSPGRVKQSLIRAGGRAPTLVRRPPRRKSSERISRVLTGIMVLSALAGVGVLGSRAVHSVSQARTRQRAMAALTEAREDFRHGLWSDCEKRAAAAYEVLGQLNTADTVMLAEACEASHDPQQSIHLLRGMLDRKVVDAEAYLVLARASREGGQYKTAAAAYDKAHHYLTDRLLANPTDAVALWRMGQWFLDHNQVADAVDRLKLAIHTDPQLLRAHIDLGTALRRTGQLLESENVLRAVLQTDPNLPEGHEGLALTLQSLGQHEAAIQEFQAALAQSCDSASTLHALGISLKATGRLPEAELALKRAVELQKHNDVACLDLADCLAAQGLKKKAATLYQQTLETFSGRALVEPSNPEVWLGVGRSLAGVGQLEPALQAFEKVRHLDPSQVEAMLQEAECFGRLGQYEVAMDRFAQAQRYLGEGCQPAYRASVYLMASGHVEEAQGTIASALQNHPGEPSLELLMGQCLMLQKKDKEAARTLAHALLDRPGCTVGLELLARCETSLKNYELAALHYQKLSTIDPRVSHVWLLGGQAWLRSGQTQQALASFKEGRRRHPEEFEFTYWLGVCHQKEKAVHQARKDFEAYLEQAPHGAMVDEARTRLRSL